MSRRTFVVGTGKGYRLGDIANTTMVASERAGLLPCEDELVPQLDALANAITREGHDVSRPPPCAAVPDQTCPRDAGFTLGGGSLYMGTSGISTRVEEGRSLAPLVRAVSDLQPVHLGGMVDGGDVLHEPLLLGRGSSPSSDILPILVGVNERTSLAGLAELRDHLSATTPPSLAAPPLVKIPHKRLHLDCALTLVDSDCGALTALTLAGSGIDRLPYPHKEFEDDGSMASNLLWLSRDRFITREAALDSDLTRHLLDACGKTAIALPFDALPKLGGSVRCATLPLDLNAN